MISCKKPSSLELSLAVVAIPIFAFFDLGAGVISRTVLDVGCTNTFSRISVDTLSCNESRLNATQIIPPSTKNGATLSSFAAVVSIATPTR